MNKFDKCSYWQLTDLSQVGIYILCYVYSHKLITTNKRICMQPLIYPYFNMVSISLNKSFSSFSFAYQNLTYIYGCHIFILELFQILLQMVRANTMLSKGKHFFNNIFNAFMIIRNNQVWRRSNDITKFY